MDSATIARLIDQVIEGVDIPCPDKMLKLSSKRAGETKAGMPYSINSNLWHAVYWQDLWLKRIRGEEILPQMEVWTGDWQTPDDSEFPELRQRFIEGLHEARGMCDWDGLDDEQLDRLIRIAVHGAYHLGQMNLLKRNRA